MRLYCIEFISSTWRFLIINKYTYTHIHQVKFFLLFYNNREENKKGEKKKKEKKKKTSKKRMNEWIECVIAIYIYIIQLRMTFVPNRYKQLIIMMITTTTTTIILMVSFFPSVINQWNAKCFYHLKFFFKVCYHFFFF